MVLYRDMTEPQIHQLRLTSAPFAAIASGTKTIESRLYDEKRRRIEPGDLICFTNTKDSTQNITMKVIGLLRYATFHDLFAHNNPAKFGGDNVTLLERQIREFYSEEDEREYGVVGIEIEVIDL